MIRTIFRSNRRTVSEILLKSSLSIRPEGSSKAFRSVIIRNSASKSANNENFPYLKYSIIGGFLVTAVGGTNILMDELGGTEGLFRAVSFYSLAIPKYILYRYHAWKQSPDHVWDKLDRETAQQGLQKILELEGFYIKCGQMCAANIGDAFPPIWQDTMSILQDEVPPQNFEKVIRPILESELDFKATFASFDPTPIGSASIGQVHRATLKDGTHVVVKVCYPNVERLLRGDVRTIKTFAKFAQPVHVPALEEIEKQFQTEFDYRLEAEHLRVVRENLTRAGLAGPDKICMVPKPYMEYCTKRVLVMEELSGDKLAVELKKELKEIAEKQGKTPKEFMAEIRQKEAAASEQGEILHGPTASQYDLYISMEDGRRRMRNAMNRLHNIFLGWMPHSAIKDYQDRTHLPINHAKLVDDLIYIHGHEVLVDGYFNGDPHPGNILFGRRKDGTPQLGLIDYGQVKQLSKEKRHMFAKIVIALDNDDKDEIVRLTKEAGFKSTKMDPDVIYLYAKVGYDEDNRALTGGKHIQLFMEELENRDPIIELPKDFIMVSRCTLLLRGLAHALHQPRSVARIWRTIAERVLREDI